MIKVENLHKSFGKNQVLNNLSVTFNTGGVYGIVGENGAGKTTLFRCIAGLEEFDGLVESNAKMLKDELGYLMTESYFLPKLTGKEYIQLLTNARGLKINDIEERNVFDLPLNQYASTYSTGMKKKLALTAVLLQNSNYFILDEPFNGVDIQSNLMITEIILKLKELGKTVLISSHIFSTLTNTCDQIYLLKKGEGLRLIEKENFNALEAEMKTLSVGNKIEKLGLV